MAQLIIDLFLKLLMVFSVVMLIISRQTRVSQLKKYSFLAKDQQCDLPVLDAIDGQDSDSSKCVEEDPTDDADGDF